MGTYTATVSTGSCASGDMGFFEEGRRVTGSVGPKHITYQAFRGTLPAIRAIGKKSKALEFWISQEGIECQTNGPVDIDAETTGGNPASGWEITAQNVPVRGGFLCILSSLEINASGTLDAQLEIQLI